MTGKIGYLELVVLMTLTIVGTAFVELPRYMAMRAEQSGWISVVLGALGGLIIVFILCWLARRFPGKTLVGYAEAILGRPLGKLVAIAFAALLLVIAGMLIREFAYTIIIATQPMTPDSLLVAVFVLLVAYQVYWGLEVIARVAVTFLPYIFISPVLVTFGTLGYVKLGRYLPLLGTGLGPILKASLYASMYYSEMMLASMILPRVRACTPARTRWALTLALGLAVPPLTAVTASCIGVFGPSETSRLVSPALELARLVTFGESVQRMEAIFVVFWMLAAMVKIGIFTWSSTEAIAEALGLVNYRALIPSGSLLLYLLAMLPESIWDEQVERGAMVKIMPYILIGVPLLLALLAWVTRKKGAEASES